MQACKNLAIGIFISLLTSMAVGATEINIPAGSLAGAITELSIQTQVQILAPGTLIKDTTTSGLSGEYSAEEALRLLVKDSGLIVKRTGERALTLLAEPVSSVKVEEMVVMGSYTTLSMNGATGLEMSLRETPQSVSIMTTQMIQDKALVDMRSVLKHTPGISMVGDASEGYLIYARGFVLDAAVQVDGLITTPAKSTYAGGFSQSIDPVIAERIEVLKGAAGILGGLGEPSATVNMIRKRPTVETQGYVYGSIGSWNTYRTEADISGALTESGKVRGRLVGAYQDGDSFLDRYSRKNSVIYGVIEADVGPSTKLSLAIDHLNSDSTGVYNWNSNPAYYTDGTPIKLDKSFSTGQYWAYRDVTETSVMPEIEHTFSNDWFVKASYRYSDATMNVLNASLGDYVDKTTGDFVGAWGPGYAGLSDRSSKTHSFNLYTTGDFSLFNNKHELIVGFSQASNEFIRISTDADTPPVNVDNILVPAPDFSDSTVENGYKYGSKETQTQTGLYTTARFSLADPLKLMVGGRLSNWEYGRVDVLGDGDDVNTDADNIVTPYIGIVYDINEYASVYTSHTGVFLPVTVYGADGQLLDPTEGTNTEAGIKLAFFDNGLNISAAIYKANKDNKDNVAEWANEGRLPSGDWIYKSINGINTKGYELEIAGALSKSWNMSGGYTHNTAEDKEGEVRQTYIPADVFKITTSHQLAGILQGITIGGSVRWQSETYYEDAVYAVDPAIPFTQKQPSYLLLDVMARYEINNAFTLGLNINNLLDESYNRSLWGYTDVGEPRNASVSLRWTF